MKRYKLNNENKKPTKEAVQRYKNFSNVKHRYDNLSKRPKQPLYKNPKFFIGLVLIVVIALLVFEASNNSNKKVEPDNKTDSTQININNKN